MSRQPEDLTGRRFGRLIVLKLERVDRSARYWQCICDCDRFHVAQTSNLRAGHTRSCGCYRTDYMRSSRTVHGETDSGGRRSAEYACWASMLQRCGTPSCSNYKNYGGRGISVCHRWRESFADFLSDMGRKPSPMHSIDRINNDGHYEPENCRWATAKQQANNRRHPRQVST